MSMDSFFGDSNSESPLKSYRTNNDTELSPTPSDMSVVPLPPTAATESSPPKDVTVSMLRALTKDMKKKYGNLSIN